MRKKQGILSHREKNASKQFQKKLHMRHFISEKFQMDLLEELKKKKTLIES